MSLDLLLRAIQFVETNFDHNYCSPEFAPFVENAKKEVNGKSSRRRGCHNELERKRRADLRGNLELLKHKVPGCSHQRRISTVNLLDEAASYIHSLKGRSDALQLQIGALQAELEQKQKKFAKLGNELHSETK